ncbi:MAG: tetratricopeptide repeat protein [Pseudomonadales bacterium]
MTGYSTKEVADLVDLPRETIWELTRAGVLEPDRTTAQYQFSFQDILILRTAKELIQEGVRKSRLNRALAKIKQQLPSNRPLSSLRLSRQGNDVVVRDQDQIFNAENGQLLLNFDLTTNPAVVAQLARREKPSDHEHLSSDDWFDLGVDLEAVSPDDAPAAYRRALELDPYHADAHVNLGRMLQERREPKLAEKHYRAALEIEPDNVLAAFNLGTLLEDLGRLEDAITAYKLAEDFADAHYNLSRLYELLGEHELALTHLKTYRQFIESDH